MDVEPGPDDRFELAGAQAVLAAQPFSELVGAQLSSFGDGLAELRIPLDDRHRQQDGVVHGGVMAYAADNALTFAAGAAVGPGVWTAGFTISYVARVTGSELIARAEVVQAGSRLVTVRAELFDRRDDGEHRCAVAQGTVARR
jgi:uncharacterized protein (TIGR00369 family)